MATIKNGQIVVDPNEKPIVGTPTSQYATVGGQNYAIAADTAVNPPTPLQNPAPVNNTDYTTRFNTSVSNLIGGAQPAPQNTDVRSALTSLIGEQAKQSEFTAQQNQEQGIDEKTKALNAINNRILLTTKSYDDQIKELQKNATGQLAQGNAIAVQDLTRKKNEDLANIGIQKLVAQNDLSTAQELIKNKVAAKFEPIQNTIDSLIKLYTLNQNDLTESQKLQAQAVIKSQESLLTSRKTAYETVMKMLAENGAPASTFANVDRVASNSKTTAADIYSSGGEWAAKPKSGVNPNTLIDNERAMFAQFRAEPIVKDYNDVLAQKLTMDSYIQNGVGGPTDLALVYSFMKGLDPTSVVRETEYAIAAKSGNLFKGIFSKFNGYFKEDGGFLPPSVKTEFQKLVDLKLAAKAQQYNNVATNYRDIAKRQNLNPDNVVLDYAKAAPNPEQPKPILNKEKLSIQIGNQVASFRNQASFDAFVKKNNLK